MKILIFVLTVVFINPSISAQCYIQYTYDTSGNRIKREYVGGCAILKPVHTNDQIQMVADTLAVLHAENRVELIRQDMDGEIRCYPNPSSGLFHFHFDHLGQGWSYSITSMSGQVVSKNIITTNVCQVDITEMKAAPYHFILVDDSSQIIYKTIIIKQ